MTLHIFIVLFFGIFFILIEITGEGVAGTGRGRAKRRGAGSPEVGPERGSELRPTKVGRSTPLASRKDGTLMTLTMLRLSRPRTTWTPREGPRPGFSGLTVSIGLCASSGGSAGPHCLKIAVRNNLHLENK